MGGSGSKAESATPPAASTAGSGDESKCPVRRKQAAQVRLLVKQPLYFKFRGL